MWLFVCVCVCVNEFPVLTVGNDYDKKWKTNGGGYVHCNGCIAYIMHI